MYEYLTVEEVRDLVNGPDCPCIWARLQVIQDGEVSWVRLDESWIDTPLYGEQPLTMTRFYLDMDEDLVIDGAVNAEGGRQNAEVKEAEE